MLFLMNDVVFNIGAEDLAPPETANRFKALSLTYLSQLAGEMFSEAPALHHDHPARARRLAALVITKESDVNAMHISAPERGCAPTAVAVRYAQVSFEVIAALYQRQQAGGEMAEEVDHQVWRRAAAA